jgi:hypothetical protein
MTSVSGCGPLDTLSPIWSFEEGEALPHLQLVLGAGREQATKLHHYRYEALRLSVGDEIGRSGTAGETRLHHWPGDKRKLSRL